MGKKQEEPQPAAEAQQQQQVQPEDIPKSIEDVQNQLKVPGISQERVKHLEGELERLRQLEQKK